MKTYAYLGDGSVVLQLAHSWINEEGAEIPVEELYPAEMFEQMIDVTDLKPMPDQHWTYDGVTFSPPVPYQPSPEEVLSQNQLRQAAFKATASIAMTPYMLSLNLGDATEEETAMARSWQSYYRALDIVDMNDTNPDWPVAPV